MDTTTTTTSTGPRPRSQLFGQSAGGRIMQMVLARHFSGPQVATALTTAELGLELYRYASKAIRAVWGWIISHFVVSVDLGYAGEVKQSVLSFVADEVLAKRRTTGLVAHEKSTTPGDYDFARFAKSSDLQLVPKFQSVWFFHKRHLLNVRSSGVTTCDDEVNEHSHYAMDLYVMCLGVSPKPIVDFLATCRALYDEEQEMYITTFANSSDGKWNRKGSRQPRPLSSVHLAADVKEKLVADIRHYLDARTKRNYALRNIPYRRGYLFHGPPGTGKSTLSEAIAGTFELNIYTIDLASVAGGKDLGTLFRCLPQRCIVLLEDIDVAGLVRDNNNNNAGSSQPQRTTSCTLSGVLQALDGVGSQEGRIVVMTTNCPEDLDEALIRPGRVDRKIHLGNAGRDCARDMFIRMVEPNIASSHDDSTTAPGEEPLHDVPTCCDLCPTLDMEKIRELAAEFARQVPENKFSPSQLQGFFQMHLECPQSAVAQVAEWIEKQNRSQFEEETPVQGSDVPESLDPKEDDELDSE